MGILMWMVIGLIAAVVSLLIKPDNNRREIIISLIVGVAGAVGGGLLGTLLGFGTITGMHFMKVVLAILCASLLLNVFWVLDRR